MDRDFYAANALNERNPSLVYDHYQQYGSKFGLYYNEGETLTAKFCAITGPDKDWRTDDGSFKALVDEVVQRVPAG